LKFVYSGESSVYEICSIINKLNEAYKCNITPDQILLMPEGATQDQLEANSLTCAEECIKHGWRFCDRLHIRIWNDKKCV
jgi:7-carboxy-7-deazaguanine synthase